MNFIKNRKGPNDPLFFTFNQDSTCLSVGYNNGYRIFNCEPFSSNIYYTEGGIGIVEMLYSSSLVALVGSGEKPAFSPRRLKLWNTQVGNTICELDFTTRILAVKLNRKRMIVGLDNKIYVYDLNTMKNLHELECASSSTPGLCALSPNEEQCFLAIPTGVESGDVLLFDAKNLSVLNVIQAHKSSLSRLAFSTDGSLLATASSNGTIIRVFEVPSGKKVGVFRRGSYPATIQSLSFDHTNTWLGVTSSSKTAHVFRITKDENTQKQGKKLNTIASGVSDLLPDAINGLVEPTRSFANVKIPFSSQETTSICAISDDILQVVTSDNVYLEYGIAPGVLEKLREIPLSQDTIPEN